MTYTSDDHLFDRVTAAIEHVARTNEDKFPEEQVSQHLFHAARVLAIMAVQDLAAEWSCSIDAALDRLIGAEWSADVALNRFVTDLVPRLPERRLPAVLSSVGELVDEAINAGYWSTEELADWEDAHPDATHAERSAARKEIRAKYPNLDRREPER